MAEQEPTISPTLERERAKLAEKRAAVEREEILLNSAEAFGKFEEGVQPAEGEVTYQQYLEQRPAEGVYRAGTKYRDAQSENFASKDAYEAQRVSSQDHYDQVGGLVNEGPFEAPDYSTMSRSDLFKERDKARELGDVVAEREINHTFLYEHMGVFELAKEAARARQLGDSKEEQTIREALVTHLTIDAMKDDTESSVQAQARYEQEVARYEALVERFLGRPDGNAQPSEQVHVEPNGEGAPSARVEPQAEVQPEQELKKEVEPGAYYNGKKVSVSDTTFVGFDEAGKEKIILTVVDDQGVVSKGVLPSELSAIPAEKEATQNTDAVAEKIVEQQDTIVLDVEQKPEEQSEQQPEQQPEAQPIQPEQSIPSRELELYNGELEAPKKWWQKAGDRIRTLGGASYWKDKFTAALGDPKDSLNRGIDDSMNEEERDTHRKRNRYVAIFATAALLAPTFLTGIVAGAAGNSAESNGTETTNSSTSSSDSTGEQLDLEAPIVPPSEATTIPPEVITVQPGQGGYDLFQSYGLDATVWDSVAPTLATQFPQDFYREGNDVRLMRSGQLSQGAQDFINSLRQG